MARTPQSGRQRMDFTAVRKPEAATFRALNVPFVGARRVTGAGENASRLASALGQFGAALSYYGDARERNEKQEKEYHEQMIAAHGGMSSEGRAKVSAITGSDYATDSLYSEAEIKVNKVPEMERRFDQRALELEKSGYTYTDENDPEGGPKPLTPDHVIAEARAKAYDVFEAYPGPANLNKAAPILKQIFKERDTLIDKINKYRETQHEAKASGSARMDAYATALEYHFAGVTGDAFTQGVLKEASDMYRAARGKDTKIAGEARDHVTLLAITSFDSKLDEPKAAMAFMEFISGRPSPATGSLRSQPMFQKTLEPMIERARKTIEKYEGDAMGDREVHKNAYKMMAGEPFNSALTEDITNGAHKVDAKKINERTATLVDEYISMQMPNAIDANRARVFQFAGSGLTSPQVEAHFEDIGLNLNDVLQDPERIEQSVFVYRDITSIDPLRVDKYIKSDKVRKALGIISDIADARNISVAEAASLYTSKLATREELPNPFKQNGMSDTDFYRVLNRVGEMTGDMKDEIRERVIALAAIDGTTNKEQLKELTEKVAADVYRRNPKINDTVLSVPPGVDPASYTENVEAAIAHFLEQEKLPFDDESVGVRSMPDGFFLTDKQTGRIIRLSPDGDGNRPYAFFTHADILQWGRAKATADAAKGVKKRYGNINIGSPYLRAENMRKIQEAQAAIDKVKEQRQRVDAYGGTQKFFKENISEPIKEIFTHRGEKAEQDSIDKRFLINDRFKKIREKANPK